MQAVVIGGGLTGLLSARVLADAGHAVTLLERDTYPEAPAGRDGVPQGRHVHILLRRGYEILCRRIPELAADLESAGAPHLQVTQDLVYHGPAGLAPRFSSGLEVVLPSRNLLEWLVRRRIAADPRITIRIGARVEGLLPADTGDRIGGVMVREGRRGTEAAPLEASLVVDASGRSSAAPRWLEALGYPAPEEITIPTQAAYATRWYRHPSPPAEWRGIAVLPQLPDGQISGFINPAEDGQFIVTLAGIKGTLPPIDEQGFLDFARGLPEPRIAAFLAEATPISAIHAWRKMGNTIRRYDRLPRQPGGFVVIGDAFCAFNPVYGQGITVGTMGAEALAVQLSGRHAPQDVAFARAFFRRLGRIVQIPWTMATSQDIRHAAETGALPMDLMTRLSSPYMDEFLRLTTEDPRAFLTFLEVVHMVRSPAAVMQPRFFVRVLGRLLRRLGRAA